MNCKLIFKNNVLKYFGSDLGGGGFSNYYMASSLNFNITTSLSNKVSDFFIWTNICIYNHLNIVHKQLSIPNF